MTNETPKPVDEQGSKRRWRWTRRVLLGGGIAVVLAGTLAWFTGPHHRWHHHHWRSLDTATATERAQAMTRRLLGKLDASGDQAVKVQAIVAGAIGELMPMREQARSGRDQAMRLLTAPSIDRDAIERLREEHLALHERASRRIAAALVEIGETLTLDQRERLARMIAERRWGRAR